MIETTTFVPEQLQNPKLRFIRIRIIGSKPHKAPQDPYFLSTNNYKFDDPKLLEWVWIQGGNYGIIGGVGNLCVIDCDSKLFYNHISNELPDTFTVKTPRGYHLYYYTDHEIDTYNYTHLGDIIGRGSYAIGVYSVSTKSIPYLIHNDNDIIALKTTEILDIVKVFDKFNSETITKAPPIIDNATITDNSCWNYPLTIKHIGSKHKDKRFRSNQTIRKQFPTHSERVGLVYTLAFYTHWNQWELLNFLERHNQWSDFDSDITAKHIDSIYRHIHRKNGEKGTGKEGGY